MPAFLFAIRTFGCKLNQYDSQALREVLATLGGREADPGDRPDLIVFNTCTVTHVSDQKLRQAVRKAARETPAAALYITGCAAARARTELAGLPGVVGVYPPGEWDRMAADWIVRCGHGERLPVPDEEGITAFAGHARALVKIQEGCSGVCSYCIVPAVRGAPRSRPLARIVAEARRLAEGGFEELVLTGTHIGLYGVDAPGGPDLAGVVGALLEAVPGVRLRLSSLEAVEVSGDLVRIAQASGGRLCPHFHLPLQSGDDAVLRAMRRPYDAAGFLAVVDRLRGALDRPALSTDIIVGFPGEGAREFESTVALCRRAGFSRLHVFPFSPRPGTPAAAMPGRPAPAETAARAAELGRIGEDAARSFAGEWVGAEVEVVAERAIGAGRATGYTERYVRAELRGEAPLRRRLMARAVGRREETLLCEEAGAGTDGRRQTPAH